MNNNFGTGGYGQSANAPAAKFAAGYSNPYIAIAQFLVSRASQNIGGAIDDSHRINQQVNTKGQADINAAHSSPFGVADEMGSQIFPGAEKMLSANTKPLEVAPGSIADQNAEPWDVYGQIYRNYYKGGGY